MSPFDATGSSQGSQYEPVEVDPLALPIDPYGNSSAEEFEPNIMSQSQEQERSAGEEVSYAQPGSEGSDGSLNFCGICEITFDRRTEYK